MGSIKKKAYNGNSAAMAQVELKSLVKANEALQINSEFYSLCDFKSVTPCYSNSNQCAMDICLFLLYSQEPPFLYSSYTLPFSGNFPFLWGRLLISSGIECDLIWLK